MKRLIMYFLKFKLERELIKLQLAQIELSLLQIKQAKEQTEKQLIYLN